MIEAARVAAARSPQERQEEIVAVLLEAFGDLLEASPDAFRGKFRKMAGSPFAFYRGSAPLFYGDMAREQEPLADPRASRVWIQGDLHAENFGTYMDASGRLVFDVNDFDEAYIGHFGWDLGRLVASLALLGYEKAFSDEDIEAIVAACGSGYVQRIRAFADGAPHQGFALTLARTSGLPHAALERARTRTRSELLNRLTVIEGCDRRLRRSELARDVAVAERGEVEDAFRDYLNTLPEVADRDPEALAIKDMVAVGGFGIGSAGLPAYTVLLEGPTDALETDILLSIKQANVCAPSRVVHDEHISEYFEHHGMRTVLSQRALQAHADPWLGYTVIGGRGQVVKELSPYEEDLDWEEINDREQAVDVAGSLGEAVAKMHSVADSHADLALVPFAAEEAIAGSIESEAAFLEDLCEFALAYADVVRDDHRLFVDAFRNHQIAGL